MELRVSAPGQDLTDEDIDRIQKDLEKLDRRLSGYNEVYVECRINRADAPTTTHHAVLEVEYRRHHLVAKADHADMGQAVRQAREEIIRQINDRSRGSHSDYAKGR